MGSYPRDVKFDSPTRSNFKQSLRLVASPRDFQCQFPYRAKFAWCPTSSSNARILGLRPGSFGREWFSASYSFYLNRSLVLLFSFWACFIYFQFVAHFRFALMPRGTSFLVEQKGCKDSHKGPAGPLRIPVGSYPRDVKFDSPARSNFNRSLRLAASPIDLLADFRTMQNSLGDRLKPLNARILALRADLLQ